MFEFFSLSFISLLGAMSPGPDFAIVTRHALTGCRRSAILASFGVCLAVLVHVTYCALGIGVLVENSPTLFRIIQVAGSCYLGYLGVRILIDSKTSAPITKTPPKKAFWSGFLTNLLNPKATLFILSIFTQFINPQTPIWTQFLYGLTISGTALIWFCTLSFLITHPAFLPHFARFQKVLMRVMGVVLLLLALSVLYSSLTHKI